MDATLDPSLPAPPLVSIRSRWIGRAVSALPILFLLLDAAMKLARLPPVLEASARLGLPERSAASIGLLELACIAVHLAPRTATLGAVLLTGFLGGAVAMHMRIGDPMATHTLFPVYMGALVWVGLYLRDARARALLGGRR